MASIVMYSAAYRGDVYPFAPIGNELSRRGHRVTYVVPREFHLDFVDEDFDCVHSGTDFSPMTLNLPENAEFVRRWGMRLKGALLMKLYFGKLTVPHLDLSYDTLKEAADEVDMDLLLSHPASSVIGQVVAEKMERPWVSGDLFPMLRRTNTRPPIGMPDLGRFNHLLWDFSEGRVANLLTYVRHFDALRERVGLAASGKSFIEMMMSSDLNLGLASPHYVPPAPDWPANYHQLGFSFWEGPGNGELAPEVREFLDAGSPPVVVALGTSAATANPEVFGRTLEQLERHDHRAVLLASTESLAAELADRARSGGHAVWPFVPLQALLKRSKAVVQSGAHGTNAMALAAGLPSVVVPSLFDQLWHGERQEELGTGVLVRKAGQLEGAIERVLTDLPLAKAAQDLGNKMANENGPAAAADKIEELLVR